MEKLTRRAALAGAVTITGLATVPEVLASVEMTGALTTQDQLKELASKFVTAAKVIDPTIKGTWLGYNTDPEEQQLYWIHLEREKTPFVRKSEKPKHPDAELLALGSRLRKEWKEERRLYTPAVHKGRASKTADAAWKAALDKTTATVREIEGIKAKTLEGLKILALAYFYLHEGDPNDLALGDQNTTDLRIAEQIIRSLLFTADKNWGV